MNIPTPAFLALAATLTLQVGVLAWIFSARSRSRLVAFLIAPGRFWLNHLRGRKS